MSTDIPNKYVRNAQISFSRQNTGLFWLMEAAETAEVPGRQYQTLKCKVTVLSLVGNICRTNKPIVSDNKFLSISAVVSSKLERSHLSDPNCTKVYIYICMMYILYYIVTASVWLLTRQLQPSFISICCLHSSETQSCFISLIFCLGTKHFKGFLSPLKLRHT